MMQAEQFHQFKAQIPYAADSEVDAKILLGNLIHMKIDTLVGLSYSELMNHFLMMTQAPLYFELEDLDEHTYKILESVKKILLDLGTLLEGSGEQKHSLIQSLQSAQKALVHKFHILYLYTNELLLYVNILERKYRLAEVAGHTEDEDFDYSRFYTDIRQFVFHTDYLGSVEEKMKAVIEKIPLSMTKENYFDAVERALKASFKNGSENHIAQFTELLKQQFEGSNVDGFGRYFKVFYSEIERIKKFSTQELDAEEILQISSLGEALGSQLKDILSTLSLGYGILNRLIILFSIENLNRNQLFTLDENFKTIYTTVSAYIASEAENYDIEEQIESLDELLQTIASNHVSFYKEIQQEVQILLDLFDSQNFEYDHHLQQLFLLEDTLFTYINVEIHDRYTYIPDTHEPIDQGIIQNYIQSFKDYITEKMKDDSQLILNEKMKSVLKLLPPIFYSETSFMDYFTSTMEGSVSAANKFAVVNELVLIMDQYGYFTAQEHGYHQHDH